jgi:two-component system, NarL family, sensor kinase
VDFAQPLEYFQKHILHNRHMAELSQSEIIFILSVASAGILLLVGGIFSFVISYQKRIFKEHRKQKELDELYSVKMIEAQLDSQEKERKRIAADLHDSIGSLLWGAKLNASYLERSFQYASEQQKSYTELMTALDQSLAMVKRIAWELTPAAFHQAGLSISIAQLCKRLNGSSLKVTFAENETYNWNDERALSAFRIIQELVSNCIKHAQATEVKVLLNWSPKTVEIIVSDNGIGLKLNKERTGVGWWNIQQRVKQLNALISIGNPPMSQGTKITILTPLMP